MTAAIICIGDELLIGQTINTNASFISHELNKAGIPVGRVFTIGDNRDEILDAMQLASRHADIMIITGGLGPTNDDITKNTLCEYFHSKLVLHEPSLKNIRDLFYNRGIKVSDVNRRQAFIPDNCTPLINKQGTAPGMWFHKKGKHFFSLPGVPFEMKELITGQVIPQLIRFSGSKPIIHKTILITGIGESALAEKIKDWEKNLPQNIKLAYLPEPGIVKLRLSCYEAGENKEGVVNKEVNKLKTIIPDLIFGYENDTLPSITGELLLKKKATLATAESCTGGLIAHLITSVPGCSRYYKGSVVAYDNTVKTRILGVDKKMILKHGAVSEEVVKTMALGAQKIMNADYALATSGIAGPDGGTAYKPVGTVWIALATQKKIFTEKLIFTGDRERIIRRASLFALNMLRKELIK